RYYAVTRRDEQAIARFEALLPSPHLSPADLVSLARCHARRKSPSQAAALYRRALQRDPLANAARTSLALHYLNRNMYDLALPILQEALARATNDLYARLALISLYRARNWNEDAFRLARETCTLFPLHDRAHRAAAQTAADSSFDASAEASYLAALSCRPPNYAERDALIRLYQRQRRFDTAARHIELLRTYHPTDPLPWILAARSAFLQRDPDAGIPICQAALTLFPDHPTFHQHLGDFFYMRGQRDHAINAYRACLTYEPNFLWLRRYLDFLTEKSDAFFLKYDLSDQTCKKRATAALRLPLPRDERQSSVIFRRALVQLYQDGSSRQQFHFMVRVLSPRGVQAASSVHLPPGQLLRAVTYKPDGRILEATHLDVGQIEFPDVQVGDVIEYKYRTDRYGGSWLDQHFFSIFAFDVAQSDVQRADVVLAVPTNRLVSWFSQPHRLPPRKSLLDGYHVFHWSLRNIPIFSVEPSAPAYLDVAHSLALSTIPNWHTIAEWQRAMLSDLTRADADVHRLAREITRHATSDAQRVAAIFSFITANFRYTRMYESSIASIKPHPLPDILANRCGDCKDLSLLMIELLKACAISSFPALIRTIDNGHLVTNVPAPDVFNHMIVYIPALHHGLFVDPTFRHGEWDLLPASCQGVWAFVVDDSSYRFIRTPIAPPHDALTALCFSGVIAPDGSCTGTMPISRHRLDADIARESLERMDDCRKIGSYYVARIEPNSRLTSFAALHATPTNLPLILSIGFSAPRFAQPSDAFLSLSLPWPLEPEEIHGGLEHRTHPLRLDSLHEENRQYQLHLPKGASCSIPTTNLFLHSPFGSFSFSASQHNNLLLASWRLSLSQRDIPTNTYPSFRRFLSRCATATSQLILIHLPPSPPHQPNPASLPSLPLPN
ncbi:MAG: DUF3857 domain-containing protein, partial [bacterium]|nr:DUF3857 domain-containing protein [bacterium]